jgi:hypothetical protein
MAVLVRLFNLTEVWAARVKRISGMTVLLEREFLPCHTGSEGFCLAPIPQPKHFFVKSLATEMKPRRDAISGPSAHEISLFAATDA